MKPPPPSPLDLFAALDEDKSGSVSREEFSKALKEKLKLKEKQIDALFAELDTNGDGSISLLEFVKVLKAQPEIFEKASAPPLPLPGVQRAADKKKDSTLLSPNEYFEAIDTDGSGTLSLEELTAALKVNHFSDEAIFAIFDECDREKTGEVSLLQWMRMAEEREELLPARLERPPPFISAESPIDLFVVVDADGSGTIDAEEFRAALSERFMSPASIEKLFAEADSDKSGDISLLEWSRAIKKFPELTRTGRPSAYAEYLSPIEYFQQMDRNGDGYVTKAELAAALTRSNISPKAIGLIFATVDTDGSGDVDLVEWAAAVRACPELLPEKLGSPSEDSHLGERIVGSLAMALGRDDDGMLCGARFVGAPSNARAPVDEGPDCIIL